MRLLPAIALLPSLVTVAASAQEADQRAVVAEVRRIVRGDYVVAERRPALDAVLARGLADGRYTGATPVELAERITSDLMAVAHDGHLNLRYAPDEASQLPMPQGDDTPSTPFLDEQARRHNHGVAAMRVDEGNIRYIDYRGFMWAGADGRASAAAIDQAVAFLRDGDAAVIDLRQNGGGDPAAVRHLASYFVPGGTPLVTFHLRDEPPTVSRAEATVPGGRITPRPIYVLTSRRTYSAAEEFAAHVARFGFATLVGEPTGGGAYRNEFYPIRPGYILSVSIGRPELPGGGDWEGRGIAPGLAVPADAALDAAEADALRRLAPSRQGNDRSAMLRLAAYHAALAAPLVPTHALAAYAGGYGERIVRVDGERLTIRRGGGPTSTLVALGADRFALSGDPQTQALFVTGPDGVAALEIERADGRRERAERRH